MSSGLYLSTQIRQRIGPTKLPATFASALGDSVLPINACQAMSGSSATSIDSRVEYTTGRLSIPLFVFGTANNNGVISARVSPPNHCSIAAASGSGGDEEIVINCRRVEDFNIINALVKTLTPASTAKAHRMVVPGEEGSVCTDIEASDGDAYFDDDRAMKLQGV